jgi:hypothetical protein
MKTKLRISIALILLILFQRISAQDPENYNWYFGNYAAVNFNSGFPVAVTSAMSANEGNATISDASGNLLFYSNGINVWNRNNVVMSNGTGLMSDVFSAQAAVIIPEPGSTTRYYLFTIKTWEFTPTDLRYSIIDMTLNGGLGDVTTIKNVLVNNNAREQLMAVRHGNGTDFWIVIHEPLTYNFLAYRVTSSGLNVTPVISTVVGMTYTGYNRFGSLRFSHDCNKLVSVLGSTSSVNTTVELYDFNSYTGIVSNPTMVADYATIPGAYSAEFSPDNRRLYITSYNQSFVYQFDLTSSNIPASRVNITNTSGTKCGLLTGRDGKIYVGMVGSSYLSVINYPNVAGLGCNYQNNALYLGSGRTCRIALPNANSAYLCNSMPLPVELLSFSAEKTADEKVRVNWQTASEFNNNYFEVQRSIDGSKFKDIGTLIGAGNSTMILNYEFYDEHPFYGTNYYRLKQVDYDGKFSCSAIEVVKIIKTGISIYPDPDGNTILVSACGQSKLKIFNTLGSLLMELPISNGTEIIDLFSLSTGIYFLSCGQQTLKFIKK